MHLVYMTVELTCFLNVSFNKMPSLIRKELRAETFLRSMEASDRLCLGKIAFECNDLSKL